MFLQTQPCQTGFWKNEKIKTMKTLNLEKMEGIEGGFNIVDACGVYAWAVLVDSGSTFNGSPVDAILFQLAFNYCLFG
jgi:hypothetical protein